MNKRKLVLVGNGMAGIRCIEEILDLDPTRFEITVFGSEPHPNYNRILLSSVLAGDTDIRDIVLNDWDWYEANHITLHSGHTVVKIDPDKQLLYTDSGLIQPYDDLVLATGSNPLLLPLPGADKEGVIGFRNLQDCQTMLEAARQYQKAVVVGGGLLGLEAARGLLNLAMDVRVVHIFANLMERQLDPAASKLLQSELENQGMKFLLQKESAEIIGEGRVEGLRFKDGTEVPADLVVMAVGVRPNAALAQTSGIEVKRGIVVNDFMETNAQNVYALGECTEHRGVVYGLVAPLFEQAKVLAGHLCGQAAIPYAGSVVYTKLKVSGVDVFSAGEFLDGPNKRALRVEDEWSGAYKKVLIEDNRVVGAVLFGDTKDAQRFVQMIRDKTDVSNMTRAQILEDAGSVSALSGDGIVCSCNSVSRNEIIAAVREKGCTTVADIKASTKAASTCGGCKATVEKLLAEALGKKEPICPCTPLSRDEVVAQIRDHHLTSVFEVMQALGWTDPEGCSKCRPALNYYLNMLWPAEHPDEPASRIVNERLHANIQKDGTYSVVPRMYGGVATPAELRRIAEIAQKYQVRMVKLTGGQRIDLLGVDKKALPDVWSELGMPSGYAYGKAVRTVKTCVGSEFCRFGVQDSTSLGIDIEKKFERLNTPAKVKMAVSGCPRNCAECAVKDVGVVGIEGGWEIYVGGNGGLKLRGADLLCKVQTPADVLEWTGAFLQYYRENAVYGERTAQFVERVGLVEIQQALADEGVRAGLNGRINQALAVLDDPWQALTAPEVRERFKELSLQ